MGVSPVYQGFARVSLVWRVQGVGGSGVCLGLCL